MPSALRMNRLFELARSGRRLPHVGVALVMTGVFVVGGTLLTGLPTVLALRATVGGPAALRDQPTLQGLAFAAELAGSFGGLYLMLWAWLRWFEKRPFYTLGLEGAGAAARYARGFGLGGLLFVAALGVSALGGGLAYEPGPAARQGWAALGGVLAALLGWLVQGAAEEILTRGWLMGVIGARYRPGLGVLLSALVFTALHGFNNALSPLPVLNLFLFGLLAALYALWEGSLWGIAALHSAWNWAQGNVFGLEVSGSQAGGGVLFNLQATGADWLTGGAFGPEGGLAVTVVLGIGLAFLAWRLRQRSGSFIRPE